MSPLNPASRLPRRAARTLVFGVALAGIIASLVTWGADAPSPSAELQDTIVRSDRLEMRNTGVEGHYVFIGNVRITGTNLEVTCDRVEVFSVSDEGRAAHTSVADQGKIRRMLATGNVTISQEGRRAVCGVAEVLPVEGHIILTEKPVITDIATGVTMAGTRMTVYRDERYAVIENPEVVGPALPNLGFTPGNESPDSAPTAPTPAPAP